MTGRRSPRWFKLDFMGEGEERRRKPPGARQVKASAPEDLAEVGAKADGQTTFDGQGDIIDSGGKVEVSGSVQAGEGGAAAGGEADLAPMFVPAFSGM